MIRAIFIAALLLAAPAGLAQEAPRWIEVDGLRVLDAPNVECPQGPFTACAIVVHMIAGYGSDLLARQHEVWHKQGFMHGPWFTIGNGDKCAMTLAAGRTRWTAGKLHCRRGGNGDFYEIDP